MSSIIPLNLKIFCIRIATRMKCLEAKSCTLMFYTIFTKQNQWASKKPVSVKHRSTQRPRFTNDRDFLQLDLFVCLFIFIWIHRYRILFLDVLYMLGNVYGLAVREWVFTIFQSYHDGVLGVHIRAICFLVARWISNDFFLSSSASLGRLTDFK